MSRTEKIEGIAELTYREDNILVMRMAKGISIDIDAAKKIEKAASDLSEDIVHSNLVDLRDMAFMSSEARKYFASQDKSTVKSIAVISNPSLHKPLINLYLKFSRPTLPTKMFNTEEEAIPWLLKSLA